MKQTVRQKTTLVRFAVQTTRYVEGTGAVTEWETIRARIGTNPDGTPRLTDAFYVEWLNAYGMNAVQQQADSVVRPARVRMTYVKAVYDALVEKNVRVYLNGVMDDAHAFTLASSPDNYLEENKMIEFQVKKYEGK